MEGSMDHGSGVREPEMGNRNLEKEVRELRNERRLLRKKKLKYNKRLPIGI